MEILLGVLVSFSVYFKKDNHLPLKAFSGLNKESA